MTRGAGLIGSAVVVLMVCGRAAAAPPPPSEWSFTGIGLLPGGTESNAFGISGDGLVVVGQATGKQGMDAVIRWTRDEGLEDLGVVEAEFPNFSLARRASFDGSVIVGQSNQRAFRWTRQSGILDLGTLHSENTGFSSAWGVSDDGGTVIGTAQTDTVFRAFRWKTGDGMTEQPFFESSALNGDGSTFVATQFQSGELHAFVVTDGKDPIEIGDLPGGQFYTQPQAITRDASTVVGISRSLPSLAGAGAGEGNLEAFVWTAEGGMVGLGDFEGAAFSSAAHAVSDDGSIIVGRGALASGSVAAIWINGGPITNLKSFLLGLGLTELNNWRLTSATGISADGTTIVGTGINPLGQTEGWVARIPAPGVGWMVAVPGLALVRRRRGM